MYKFPQYQILVEELIKHVKVIYLNINNFNIMKKTNETSRSKALEWWSNKLLQFKRDISIKEYGIEWTQLTKDEIEEIWKEETQSMFGDLSQSDLQKDLKEHFELHGKLNQNIFDLIIVSDDIKKKVDNRFDKLNQKQFKEFNPRLFKTYINKFNSPDKQKSVLETVSTLSYNETEFLIALINDFQNERAVN